MTNWFAGVASLIVGFFAGWVSMRTSQKSPHDRLKQLTEVRRDLGLLDRNRVIDAAIQRELRMLERLNDAREVGRIKYAIEWASQHPVGAVLACVAQMYVGGGLTLWYKRAYESLNPLLAWSVYLAGVALVISSAVFLLVIVAPGYGRLLWNETHKVRQRGRRSRFVNDHTEREDPRIGQTEVTRSRVVHRASIGLRRRDAPVRASVTTVQPMMGSRKPKTLAR